MGNKMRILYAEDYELDAELTKILLEEHEFTVDIAADGKKAWDAYNRQKPDILLLDLNIPRKDGIEVTRLIRQKDPHTHIIIYTSHGEPEREIAALDAGADEFIPKDRTPDVLIAHLKILRQKMIADDQHGTAIVVLAALINALRVTGKTKEAARVVVNGAGSAGIAISK